MKWRLEKPNARDRGILRVRYDKVCSKAEADAIQRAWSNSNVGLDPGLIEGCVVWFLSPPKIKAKRNDTYGVKFSFLRADQPSKGIRSS